MKYGARSLLARTKSLKFSFYAPNFEEVEGAYWFGPVCLCVHACVTLAYGHEPLDI